MEFLRSIGFVAFLGTVEFFGLTYVHGPKNFLCGKSIISKPQTLHLGTTC